MLNTVLVIIVCSALAMSIYIGILALFRSQSFKKNYFLLLQSMVILYLFGHFLELISTNAEEAYTAVKVLYIGGSFVTTFTFFFICDYCNIKIHPVLVKFPMLIFSAAVALAMWTTKFHHLVYADYSFAQEIFHHMSFTPGPLYSVIHIYPSASLLLTLGVLLYQIKKWKNVYRKQLLIIFICVTIPFVFEGIYILTTIAGLNKLHIYLTPHSLAVMTFFLYLGVMRFNIFEIISVATITAMEHIREGFILVDGESNYLSSNPAAVKIFPGITKLAKGESIFSTRDWPEELKEVGNESIDFSLTGDDNKFFKASVSPVLAQNKTLIAKIILLREITDSVNLMKELENAAYIDALTGIYNRKHFTELAVVDIERALRLNQSIYTVMLDLDFFKKVNDTHGHAGGDAVLKATAGIVRQTIRSYDLLGRYGGEEFVLLITDLEAEEALKLMERIRENMEQSIIHYEGKEIKITCSIGLAEFRQGDTLESSVKKADDALYSAKNSGRNKVKVYGSL